VPHHILLVGQILQTSLIIVAPNWSRVLVTRRLRLLTRIHIAGGPQIRGL